MGNVRAHAEGGFIPVCTCTALSGSPDDLTQTSINSARLTCRTTRTGKEIRSTGDFDGGANTLWTLYGHEAVAWTFSLRVSSKRKVQKEHDVQSSVPRIRERAMVQSGERERVCVCVYGDGIALRELLDIACWGVRTR